MKKYFIIYSHLLTYAVKKLAEYRLNTLLRFIYIPSYVGVQYVMVELAYRNVPSLVGWTHNEGVLLFATFYFVYSFSAFMILTGIRDFMWNGVRLGTLDSVLTKPVDPQFLVTFGQPSIDVLFLAVGSGFLFISTLLQLAHQLNAFHIFAFILSLFFSWIIEYAMFATYATLSIRLTRAGQMVEFLDKMTDNSVYPTSIFPEAIQFMSFSIVPIAFFAYIPCSMLLGKLSWNYLGLMLGCAVLSLVISRLAWQRSLRNYTSASS